MAILVIKLLKKYGQISPSRWSTTLGMAKHRVSLEKSRNLVSNRVLLWASSFFQRLLISLGRLVLPHVISSEATDSG